MDRLRRYTCSYVGSQTWLNDARTNIGLSQTMGFLNENDSLAYFANFGRIFVRSVINCGLFQDIKFSLIISFLFQGSRKEKPRNTLIFYLAQEDQISEEKFSWLFALNLKDIPYNSHSRETLKRVHVKYVLPKGPFMSKTVATFVQKVGLIWLKDGYFSYSGHKCNGWLKIVSHWDQRDSGVMCTGPGNKLNLV